MDDIAIFVWNHWRDHVDHVITVLTALVCGGVRSFPFLFTCSKWCRYQPILEDDFCVVTSYYEQRNRLISSIIVYTELRDMPCIFFSYVSRQRLLDDKSVYVVMKALASISQDKDLKVERYMKQQYKRVFSEVVKEVDVVMPRWFPTDLTRVVCSYLY